MRDNFSGDNAKLCDCIDALLAIDAAGAGLFPRGVGGHARTMLSAAACRLRAQPERNSRELYEFLRTMQAGEMTVSRGMELIDIWLVGNYRDDMLPPVGTQPERKLTDAQPAPTRLDVMSLIHSQMHRVYASAIDREEVDTQYMQEIEDAIRSLAAQPAAATVPEWKPIETAPKDMAARLYLIGRYCVQGFVDATGELMVQSDVSPHWRKMRGRPTHWMPLPAPPAAQPQDDGEKHPTQPIAQDATFIYEGSMQLETGNTVMYACDRAGMLMPRRCGDCLCWSHPSLKAAQSGRG